MNPLHQEQLQFAINFAQGHQFSAKDMHAGLDAFFGATWDPDTPEAKDIPLICGTARLMIQRAATGRPTWEAKLKTITAALTPGKDGHAAVRYRGTFHDLFLLRLMRLIEEAGTKRIRTCAAEDCGRVFLKVTKKEYCSPRCHRRTYMKAYREAEQRGRRHANTKTGPR